MYLRLDQVDPILEAFRAVQKTSESCSEKIESQERRFVSLEETALRELQTMKEQISSLNESMATRILTLQTFDFYMQGAWAVPIENFLD
jgi:hypothetical protein